MYVHVPHMCLVPMEVRQGTGSSETGVTDCREPSYCYWKLSMNPRKSSKYSKPPSPLSSLVCAACILLGVWLFTELGHHPMGTHSKKTDSSHESCQWPTASLGGLHAHFSPSQREVVRLDLEWVFCLSQLLRVHACGVCCVWKAFLRVTDHLWLLSSLYHPFLTRRLPFRTQHSSIS